MFLLERRNQRTFAHTMRPGAKCALLTTLGFTADRLSGHTLTACVGFIAGVQITSLSRIGAWSFSMRNPRKLARGGKRAEQGTGGLGRGVDTCARDDGVVRGLRHRRLGRSLVDAAPGRPDAAAGGGRCRGTRSPPGKACGVPPSRHRWVLGCSGSLIGHHALQSAPCRNEVVTASGGNGTAVPGSRA